MVVCVASMTAGSSTFQYALGSTDAEHERLTRQAQWVNPHTEQCFREAGISLGCRVLDIGSGVGDVALLLARLVGPAGEVVGVERDTRSIRRARNRIVEAGLHNVTFAQCDISQIPNDKPFDAVVGRYILIFLPDPVSILQSLSRLVRAGGVVAFQEQDWGSFVGHARPFPLWSAAVSLIDETFRRSGANLYLGSKFRELFHDAGLPMPSVRTDLLVGAEEWIPYMLQSIHPQMRQCNLPIEKLGDFDTLSERLRAEVATSNSKIPLPSLLSAWSRKSLK
jgi:SAM-dependent methyltransferase